MNPREKAEALLAASKCHYSVLCQGINDDNPMISINADEVFSSASIIKVPILLTLFSKARLGELSLGREIDVVNILDDTQAFDTGPRKATLRELAVWMTVLSDNTSANTLIDLLGFQAVNGYTASLGLTRTRLRRKMLDFASRSAGIDNVTSARDMFTLFKHLFSVEKNDFAEAISMLRRQRINENLLRYIWEDVVIAHKTGDLDYLTHDTGVFSFSGGDVFTGVFLWGTERVGGDPRLIGLIGRMVFDYFTTGRPK